MADLSATAELLQLTMDGLVKIFPGKGLALMVFEPGDAPDRRANWISNCKKEEMLVAMKEAVARLEGRVQESETKQ